MEYKIYKLQFSTAVHFSVNALDDCEFAMCADSFFSAMCIEFLNQSEEKMNIFVENVKVHVSIDKISVCFKILFIIICTFQ